MNTLVIVFLFVFIRSSLSTNHGIDVSTLTLSSSFSCLKQTYPGYYYTIVRAWKSNGTPDTNCPSTVANAWNGGMDNVDVYMFPCFSCGNATGQVQSAVQYLASANTVYNTFWLDVEGTTLWSTNITLNNIFFQELLDAANAMGLTVGIYASKTMWTAIMGSWTGGAGYPLWYPRYNNLTNFDDFVPFNGWSQPVMKQYQQTTSICGASVDFNWYPPSPSPTASPTSSITPTISPSRSPSRTPSSTASPTPTASPTSSITPSRTPSRSPSASRTPSRSPSATPSPTRSPTSTPSVTPSVTPTSSATPTATATPTASVTASATPSTSAAPSSDPVPTPVSSPVSQPSPLPSTVCSQCSSDADCSNGRGICVSSSIGSYCACLSGFGGCDCSISPAASCQNSFIPVGYLSGKFQANATVDYQYPNLYVSVLANLEKSVWGSGSSDPSNVPPYSLETIVYFGSSPSSYPECSYPNGETTWKDLAATDGSCSDVYLSNMTWSFAKDHCGFAAINGTRNYTQTITILRRYSLDGELTREEKTTRHLFINFPSEIGVTDSNATVSFPPANAFAALSSIDYDPDTLLWTVVVQSRLSNPYSLGSPVAAQYTGNLGFRAPTVTVSGCTTSASGTSCIQTITYVYPQGSVSDPCLGLIGTDLHTFSVQCSTPSCPGDKLLNITLKLDTGDACPITDDITFSEASLASYSDSSLHSSKDSFSVLDVAYFGASVQSTEAFITTRSLKAHSVCFLPPSGSCFYANYTVLSATNGKEPVFKVDLNGPGNSVYFSSITTPTTFSVKATVVVGFEGAKSRKAVPHSQTVDTIATAIIGASSSSVLSPALLLVLLLVSTLSLLM